MSLICPICQENLINRESIDNYVNKCGHVYHSNCILQWWDSTPEPNCPECREPCNLDTITKIYLTVDHSVDNADSQPATTIPIDDPKAETLLRQIREHIDVQTYNQTKDLNDKFRQQNSDFSTMLLNNITRLRSNYDDKLSAVSKDLSTAIASEHKKLLTALDSHERPDPESYTIPGEHSPTKRRRKFMHPIAAVTCLIAVVILLVVIIYSHLILNALRSNEHSGSLNINNISQRLDALNDELQQIAHNASRDNRIVTLAVESIAKSMGNGTRTQDILNRLSEVGRRGDQLLLEQIQTDRRINLKLEVLENSINILKTHIDAEKMSKSQTKFNDETQSQLEEQNRQLQAKLEHLKAIVDNRSNVEPDQLRREIENDSELAPTAEEAKSIHEEAIELWNKLIGSGNSDSSSGGLSVRIVLIVASAVTTLLVQSNQFSLMFR